MPHLLKPPEHDTESPIDVLAVSGSHPMVITRLLLCVAICIQQLPPKADLRQLRTTVPLREMMENNITFIKLPRDLHGGRCLPLESKSIGAPIWVVRL